MEWTGTDAFQMKQAAITQVPIIIERMILCAAESRIKLQGENQ
jgi:hypothetical protein